MNVTINEGTSFVIANEVGDILPGKEAGLYSQDTRFLSRYEMFVNGTKPILLTGRQVDYYSAVHYVTTPEIDAIPPDSISMSRKRFVGNGLHEDIDIENHSIDLARITLRLEFDVDFAEIFEVKAGRSPGKAAPEFFADEENRVVSFKYQSADFYRETRVVFGELPEFNTDKRAVSFSIKLEPGRRWHTCIDFLTLSAPEIIRPKYTCESFGLISGYKPEYRADWMRKAPKLVTDYDVLQHAYDQGLLDMAALRLKEPEFTKMGIAPAAGIPWYVTLFGRDSLITAYQTLPFLSDMALGALRNLARHQGREVNPLNDEEPGKIVHEIRWGELATTGRIPHKRYYGTVDATPLFIILLSEVYKWTADKAIIEEFKEPLLKALEWIDVYGDKDDDGYVEYKRMSEKGLENQGWKDSWDCVRFADGRFPEAPIAMCEVQGYVYIAKLGAAKLLDLLGEGKRAAELRDEATRLKESFNQDFWMEAEGYFAEALDKNKNQVDAITSNPGHLLWSGIVDEEKAAILKERLLSPDMFSGWGIRTMSSKMWPYNPVSYHNGSIWPHDNSIIAMGLMNYGFYNEALKVIDSILDAGQYFAYQRLPELFCGFDRGSSIVPIEYPTSSSPQAWASGASMLMLKTLLGATARADQKLLILRPRFPSEVYRIHLAGMRIGESYISFEVLKERGEFKLNITENPGSFKVKLENWPDEGEHVFLKTGTEG
ncbi:MAG TPA: glycogen debranching N-terminal domain-containing protein [Anaerolineae bacterium]|nr:glycogen debranching N-terminal domain-containing protein [Anaerolineae bacterium]